MKLKGRVAGAATIVVGVVISSAPAFAHVTINPSDATQGGFGKFTFRVPTERDNASTTRLEVQFPADHPIAFVSVQPHQGWTASVAKVKLATPIQSDDGAVTEAVSKITWTGGQIKPGEFDEFAVSVGPLPSDVSALTFRAVQTYDNGEVVRWTEDTKAGQPEPAHPAPVLTLTKAGATAAARGAQSDGTARTLGVIGIVLGTLGLAARAFRARGRRAAAHSDAGIHAPATEDRVLEPIH
jgi:uncharacterized protein YcnI